MYDIKIFIFQQRLQWRYVTSCILSIKGMFDKFVLLKQKFFKINVLPYLLAADSDINMAYISF